MWQVFGKAGTRGAVVWLGFDWADGPQEQWGKLILELVASFAVGEDGGVSRFDISTRIPSTILIHTVDVHQARRAAHENTTSNRYLSDSPLLLHTVLPEAFALS